ncbi:hypothetical protein UB37_04965 [Photobacterium iliopiscarium]|nr:hypothetical protein UB37_04965 [Photobacterium iliopiscarium]
MKDRFFNSMSDDVLLSFTPEQKQEIEKSIIKNTSGSDHCIDLRPVIGFGKWRYYTVFIVGKDRRYQARKRESLSLLVKSLVILFGCIGLFMSAVLTMYLIKSALGIDIFKHFSFGVWDAFKHTFIS